LLKVNLQGYWRLNTEEWWKDADPGKLKSLYRNLC